MIYFASWNLVGNFSYVCCTQGLNILLNMFFNPAVNAARGVAVQVQSVIANFSYNVENAIKPQITKTFAQNEMDRMFKLMMISSRLSFYVLLLFAIPVFLEAPQLLQVWLKIVPDHAVSFLQITLLILLSESLTGSLLTAVQAKGDLKKYQFSVSLFSLIVIPVSYIALRNGAIPEVVFWINLGVSVIIQFVKLQIAHEIVGISRCVFLKEVFYRTILVAIISVILVYSVFSILSQFSQSFLRVIIVSVVNCVVVAITVWLIGVQREEKAYVRMKISSYINRK